MTPGKRRKTIEVVEGAPDFQSGDESDVESGIESAGKSAAEIENEERIERLRAELGDKEGYVVLCRRNPDTGQLATLAKLNAAVFSIEYTLQRYGGGNYVAKFFQSGVRFSEGAFKGSLPFEIDASVRPQVLADVPVPGSDGTTMGMAFALKDLADAVKDLKAAPTAAAKPAADPVETAVKLIEQIATVTRKFTPPPAPAAPAPNFGEQLKMATELVNLGKALVGEGGGGGEASSGDLYTAAVLKLADPIIEIVKDKIAEERRITRPEQPRALAPGSGPPAAPAPMAGPAAAPAMSQPGGAVVLPPWVLELRRLVPLILSRCQRNVSAENTAYFVLDDLSDATTDKIAELAARDDFEAHVMPFLPPQVANHPAWTQEFLAAMREYLLGGEDGGDEGDDGKAPPNGLGDARSGPSANAKESRTDLAAQAQRKLDAIP